jgi:hypothetical protein
MFRILLVALLFMAAPAMALAGTSVSVSSPEQVLAVTVDTGGDGKAIYTVSRFGEPVIMPSKLGFLEPGRKYRAEIYRDGPAANRKTAPSDMVIEQREVTSADTLTLRLAAGGGEAIRFTPIGGKPARHH